MSNEQRQIEERDLDFGGHRAFNPATPSQPSDVVRYMDLADRYANAAAMIAVDTTTFLAAKTRIGYVETYGDYFRFQAFTMPAWSNSVAYSVGQQVHYLGSTYIAIQAGTGHLPTDASFWQVDVAVAAHVIIPSTDGNGQWHRMSIQNPAWHARLFWAVDPRNASGLASDENSGSSSISLDDAKTRPLLTFDEMWRRWKTWDLLNLIVAVSIMSDGLIPIAVPQSITSGASTDVDDDFAGGFIQFVGNAPVLHSGTLTSGTALEGTNTNQIIEDTALSSGGWAAIDAVSSPTAGSRFIRTLDKSHHALISFQKTANAKRAITFEPIAASPAAQQQIGNSPSTAFVSGVQYEVVAAIKVPGIVSDNCAIRRSYIDVFDNVASPTGHVLENCARSCFVILGGWYDCVPQGSFRMFGAVSCGSSMSGATIGWDTGCGVLGTATPGDTGLREVWQLCKMSFLNRFTVCRGFINIYDDVKFLRVGTNIEWAFIECSSGGAVTVRSPCTLIYDIIRGSAESDPTFLFDIQSGDVHFQFPEADIPTTCPILSHVTYLGVIHGGLFFVGPPASNAYAAEFVDLTRNISLQSNTVFVAFDPSFPGVIVNGKHITYGSQSPALDNPSHAWWVDAYRQNTSAAVNPGILGWRCSAATGGTPLGGGPDPGVWQAVLAGTGGTVTSVAAIAPIHSTGGTAPVISHDPSGVTPGTMDVVTVDADGHVTGGVAATSKLIMEVPFVYVTSSPYTTNAFGTQAFTAVSQLFWAAPCTADWTFFAETSAIQPGWRIPAASDRARCNIHVTTNNISGSSGSDGRLRFRLFNNCNSLSATPVVTGFNPAPGAVGPASPFDIGGLSFAANDVANLSVDIFNGGGTATTGALLMYGTLQFFKDP